MAQYDALIEKWATLSGTIAQKLAALNALTTPGPIVDVPVGDVCGYCELMPWSAAANPPVFIYETLQGLAAGGNSIPVALQMIAAKALRIMGGQTQVKSFVTSDPAKYAQFSGMLDAFVAAGMDTNNKTALLAMAHTPDRPWWETTGYTGAVPCPISYGDLQGANLVTTDQLVAEGLIVLPQGG